MMATLTGKNDKGMLSEVDKSQLSDMMTKHINSKGKVEDNENSYRLGTFGPSTCEAM